MQKKGQKTKNGKTKVSSVKNKMRTRTKEQK